MQGQRGVIGSLAGSLEFEHGSSSGNASAEPHLYWNGMRNPDDSGLLDFTPPSNNISLLDSMDLSHQNLTRWYPGEPSSIGMHQEGRRSEDRTENMRSSSSLGGSSSLLESCVYPHSNNFFSLDGNRADPSLIQSSSTNSTPPNLNISAGFVGDGSAKSPLVECSDHLLSIGSGSDSFGISSATGGILRLENDGRRGCPSDGHRLPCKRKSYEGHIGQSSRKGSSSYLQNAGTGAWPAAPTACNLSINPSGHSMSEPVDSINGLGAGVIASHNLPDTSIAANLGSVHGNFHARINASTWNNSNSSPSIGGSSIANADSHPPVDLRPVPAMSDSSVQGHPTLIQVPVLPSSGPSIRWSRRSISRAGSSSDAVRLRNRGAPVHGEASSSSIPRHTSQHPMIVPPPDWAMLVQHHAAMHTTNQSVSIPGNVASTSRNGSSSVHQPSFSNLIPHHNRHSQFPQRLSEYVRRSLVAAMDSDSDGPSSRNLIGSGPSASSLDTLASSRANNQGHRPHPPRPIVWPERQGDGLTRIPYSIRTLAAASAGRRRLSSELRNVLEIMRRGEGLRIEDVMILDPLFFGVADIHDRYRDMRLDVDNMSYEELLALEERIGNVGTGLTEETILNWMKQRKYSIAVDPSREAEPCCICQEEYGDGEDLGTLECGHDFHRDCIKQWLMHKNLCPICKAVGLNTSKAANDQMEG